MQASFSSFTPEWAHAFGQELMAETQRRQEFVDNVKQAESERREAAEPAVDARRIFVGDIRSGVHALLNRFQIARSEMASELRAASEAFRSRPTAQAGFFSRHAAATQAPRQEGAKRPGHSKKHRG